MTQKIDVATSPGVMSGRRILMIPVSLEQPSTQPASSSSIGISSMKPRIIQIVNGILKVV